MGEGDWVQLAEVLAQGNNPKGVQTQAKAIALHGVVTLGQALHVRHKRLQQHTASDVMVFMIAGIAFCQSGKTMGMVDI